MCKHQTLTQVHKIPLYVYMNTGGTSTSSTLAWDEPGAYTKFCNLMSCVVEPNTDSSGHLCDRVASQVDQVCMVHYGWTRAQIQKDYELDDGSYFPGVAFLAGSPHRDYWYLDEEATPPWLYDDDDDDGLPRPKEGCIVVFPDKSRRLPSLGFHSDLDEHKEAA